MSLPPVSPSDLAVQAAKTVIVFAVIGTALRLFGKREASQINVYDLAMLMALANAVQNAMTAGKGNLSIGLVTSATVVLTAWLLTRLMLRSAAAERLITGSPSLLIYNGRLMADRLRRQRLTMADLDAALRAYGLTDLSQVRTAVLEVDGTISVIAKVSPDEAGPEEG
ncbi:MAG TPA: YetF domain-containing protein [Actinomycetota bacterium]|nr:YetF domain-containing protein [Actinomycetota bacterium]